MIGHESNAKQAFDDVICASYIHTSTYIQYIQNYTRSRNINNLQTGLVRRFLFFLHAPSCDKRTKHLFRHVRRHFFPFWSQICFGSYDNTLFLGSRLWEFVFEKEIIGDVQGRVQLWRFYFLSLVLKKPYLYTKKILCFELFIHNYIYCTCLWLGGAQFSVRLPRISCFPLIYASSFVFLPISLLSLFTVCEIHRYLVYSTVYSCFISTILSTS